MIDNSISNPTERRPNWWRISDSDNILDPCFKKPIYAGKSKFDFSPTFLKDNMKWFKNRMSSRITNENDYEYEYDKRSVLDYNRQRKMTQKQEYSQYKYISPYSEYLLERLRWKIALRIYYTLDPNNKGYIELEHSKKLLLDMLELDTEMAQSLLLLLETIKPFYAKDGCIEKNDLLVYLAREIFDDTRGYGLFSRLTKIFKNPIIRSKRRSINQQNSSFQEFGIINNGNICFSSDPNVISLNDINDMRVNLREVKNISHCHKKGTCITCNMNKNCRGKLKDHIEMTRDRKQKLINRINQERKNANEKYMLNCTFKPEIIWPIGRYIKKNNGWPKEKNVLRSKLDKDKRNEISGYEVTNEQDIDDKNIQIFLNNKFDSDNNWNGYIHDSVSNQVYILYKGYLFNDSNIDDNRIFYRKTDKDNQIEIRQKELDSIIRKIYVEFKNIENNETENEKRKSVNFGTSKLIEELRTKRETGINDPRLNVPEFTIEINHPEFVEKTVDLSKIEPYKEAAIHSQIDAKNESSKSCYYYLPRGYEKIGNCFNEVRFRRKLDFFYESEVNKSKNKNHNNSSSNEHLSLSNNMESKNSLPTYIDSKSVCVVDKEKMGINLDCKNEINSLSPKHSEKIESDTRKYDFMTTPLKEENMLTIAKKNNLKIPPKENIAASLKESNNPTLVKNTSATVLDGETNGTVPIISNLKIPPKKDTMAVPSKEAKIPALVKNDSKIPPAKNTSATIFNEEKNDSIPIKSNLKAPPKKYTIVTPLKEAKALLTKNSSMIPPKESASATIFNEENKDSIPIKSNLKIPPKKDASATLLNKVAVGSVPIKENLKILPMKGASVSPLKEAKALLIKNNLKIPPKKSPVIN